MGALFGHGRLPTYCLRNGCEDALFLAASTAPIRRLAKERKLRLSLQTTAVIATLPVYFSHWSRGVKRGIHRRNSFGHDDHELRTIYQVADSLGGMPSPLLPWQNDLADTHFCCQDALQVPRASRHVGRTVPMRLGSTLLRVYPAVVMYLHIRLHWVIHQPLSRPGFSQLAK